MIQNAEQGLLLIEKQKFNEKLSKIIKEQNGQEPDNINYYLNILMQYQLIHFIQRKFNSSLSQLYQQEYVALQLDQISIHSLIWILRSIKVDKMTPSEKFFISRIKECYCLKISQKLWEKKIIRALQKQKFLVNQQPQQNSDNQFFLYSSQDNCSYFPKIYIKQTQDPLIGSDTLVFYPLNEKWEADDVADKKDLEKSEWKIFLDFIINFFEQESSNNSDCQVNHINNENSSVKKDKNLLSQKIKSIPGGRYGCAQFLKICGPKELRELSLGRLNFYVQEAINQGIIRYYRTLLIKNDQSQDYKNNNILMFQDNTLLNQSQENNKDQIIEKLKQILVEILKEHSQGVSLAQIPQFMKQKLKHDFNLQELGFPKLKNFIKLFEDEISIENSKQNNQFAILKNQHIIHNNNLSMETQNYMNKVSMKNQFNFNYQSQQSMSQYPCNFSVHEFQLRIMKIIFYVLCHQKSMLLQQLQDILNQEFQCIIDFQLFMCQDFKSFLQLYMDQQLELEQQSNGIAVKLKNINQNFHNNQNYNQNQQMNHSRSNQSQTKKQMNYNAQPVDPLQYFNKNQNNQEEEYSLWGNQFLQQMINPQHKNCKSEDQFFFERNKLKQKANDLNNQQKPSEQNHKKSVSHAQIYGSNYNQLQNHLDIFQQNQADELGHNRYVSELELNQDYTQYNMSHELNEKYIKNVIMVDDIDDDNNQNPQSIIAGISEIKQQSKMSNQLSSNLSFQQLIGNHTYNDNQTHQKLKSYDQNILQKEKQHNRFKSIFNQDNLQS